MPNVEVTLPKNMPSTSQKFMILLEICLSCGAGWVQPIIICQFATYPKVKAITMLFINLNMSFLNIPCIK